MVSEDSIFLENKIFITSFYFFFGDFIVFCVEDKDIYFFVRD